METLRRLEGEVEELNILAKVKRKKMETITANIEKRGKLGD